MNTLLRCPGPESIEFGTRSLVALRPNQVRIATEFAAIKHGTEFFLFSGKSPFANVGFNMDHRMFESTDNHNGFSYRPGNMFVGTVMERGECASRFTIGQRVYGYAGLAESVDVDESALWPLDSPMTETDAVCTDPAFFGLAAVRDAKVSVGSTAAVFGMGAIGLFAVQCLKLSGCQHIIAFDPLPARRALARELGATEVADPIKEEPGAFVRALLPQGVDVALEISGSYHALGSAMRCVGMGGTVVTVGFYKGNAAPLNLAMEWHHNRLQLISSMPDWENPSREYPHWDKNRLRDTVVQLFRDKKLVSRGIVDPIVEFSQAREAYLSVYRDQSQSVKLGVRFPRAAAAM